MSQVIIADATKFRANMTNKLHEYLSDTKSVNLEKGIFNYALKEANTRKVLKKWDNPYFVTLYVDRFRTIYGNLASNKDLLAALKEGALKVHVFAFMTHQEMCPDKWEPLIQQKMKRDKSKYETKLQAATDTFTCRKCKSKECTYYQMQTRSADEPMTTFVTCLNCGKFWKC